MVLQKVDPMRAFENKNEELQMMKAELNKKKKLLGYAGGFQAYNMNNSSNKQGT